MGQADLKTAAAGSNSGTWLLRGGRVIDPDSGFDQIADVLIRQGTVEAIGRQLPLPPDLAGDSSEAKRILDLDGCLVMPGCIDAHVHLREPGEEDKEDILSGTRAAARGGFTSVACMPNTDPAVDNRANVEYIRRRAAKAGPVRVFPIGAVSRQRKGQQLAPLGQMVEAGAVAFSDDGSPVASSRLLRLALTYSRSYGVPIIDHAEDPSLSQGTVMHEGLVSSRLGLPGRPREAEDTYVARDLLQANLTGAHLHLAHLSSHQSLKMIRRAKDNGVQVTAEVTPHHLLLSHKQVEQSGYDPHFKMNPPLRTEKDRRALVAGLQDGIIDLIATDHAPHTKEDKDVGFLEAAPGVTGLETALAATYQLVRSGSLTLQRWVEALTVSPARMLNLEPLGQLQEGGPADITVFDPEQAWTVEPRSFASKGRNTAFAGRSLTGRVVMTMVDGWVAYDQTGKEHRP